MPQNSQRVSHPVRNLSLFCLDWLCCGLRNRDTITGRTGNRKQKHFFSTEKERFPLPSVPRQRQVAITRLLSPVATSVANATCFGSFLPSSPQLYTSSLYSLCSRSYSSSSTKGSLLVPSDACRRPMPSTATFLQRLCLFPSARRPACSSLSLPLSRGLSPRSPCSRVVLRLRRLLASFTRPAPPPRRRRAAAPHSPCRLREREQLCIQLPTVTASFTLMRACSG